MGGGEREPAGGGFSRRLLEFLAAERTGGAARKDSETSAVARPLLFLIDTATQQLGNLRAMIVEEKAEAEAEAEAESEAEADAYRDGKGLIATIRLLIAQILQAPESVAKHYADFAREALRVLEGESDIAPPPRDFRFKDRLWSESSFFRILLQLYLALDQAAQSWLDEQPIQPIDKRRIRFILEQLIAAVAPSNLPLNPAALRRADATEGGSVVDGVHNLLDDLLHNRAMPRQIKPNAYVIGRDLALTPGAVIYRNDLLELIQYAPQTDMVRSQPVLLIPPQINKFYFFDLRPQNSLIAHALQSGIQFFTLSWRNPTAEHAHWGLDTYVAATIKAMDVISAVTDSRTVGLVSACAGGLTAMATMGCLAARGDRRVANHTLLVTCLLPNQGSKLELFATPDLLALACRHVGIAGVMEGDALAKLFSWLRPTDLVWRYWINNYLLGKSPPPLDVLFWDNDSTRLPAALHRDFVAMYARDVFRNRRTLEVLGARVDFGKIRADSYLVGGEEDYLMPWQGCYQACRIFRGHHQFVLSTSGHVQSILRPPRLANAHYFTNRSTDPTPEAWRATCERHEGSWWSHWHAWLNAMSGDLRAAPKRVGTRRYRPMEQAPGTYVFG
ncbi:MAG TPA: alpha/beta fold hydrolase [Allosphingosinicella sp.]